MEPEQVTKQTAPAPQTIKSKIKNTPTPKPYPIKVKLVYTTKSGSRPNDFRSPGITQISHQAQIMAEQIVQICWTITHCKSFPTFTNINNGPSVSQYSGQLQN